MDGDPASIARMHERHIHFMRIEINSLHRQLSEAHKDVFVLRNRNDALEAENAKLLQRIAEMTKKSSGAVEPETPSFVKANVPDRPRRKPGRPVGHKAALRPLPKRVDIKQEVALPVDCRRAGKTGQGWAGENRPS